MADRRITDEPASSFITVNNEVSAAYVEICCNSNLLSDGTYMNNEY
jgi:hypothetical protein